MSKFHIFSKNKIQTIIHYPHLFNSQKAFSEYNKIKLPATEKIQSEILSIPISTAISKDEAKYICKIINAY